MHDPRSGDRPLAMAVGELAKFVLLAFIAIVILVQISDLCVSLSSY